MQITLKTLRPPFHRQVKRLARAAWELCHAVISQCLCLITAEVGAAAAKRQHPPKVVHLPNSPTALLCTVLPAA